MQEGDIVQIIDEAHPWFPCLIVVSEPKSFGIQGYITIPSSNDEGAENAYIRLNSEQIELVGKAAFVSQ